MAYQVAEMKQLLVSSLTAMRLEIDALKSSMEHRKKKVHVHSIFNKSNAVLVWDIHSLGLSALGVYIP